MIIHPTSLSATLDASADVFFHQNQLSITMRQELANMIISRQCQTGVNAGFFIPYAAESEAKIRLFTGELLTTTLARNHIPMIEAVRILKLLAIETHAVSQSILLASHRMEKMCYSTFCPKGECKTLTIAYLRYLSLDSADNAASSMSTHLTNLTGYRDGKGRWGGFPFLYTILMLSETDGPLAIEELKYAAPFCKKQLSQNWPADPISKRRQEIISKALARS
ncbi:MAG: hypothetical protein A2Y88_02450 [Chloroflexi bacterium RBG_13_48_10]|nr:MAG: hypothetical protein A2Y88_02450 [Chloroflexi bacterium RBG_13_48_10]